MTYVSKALAELQSKGFRLTKPRRLVVELLDRADKPLSAYEIKHILDTNGETVDTVSIYRILECLEENHLIHRVLSSGKVKKCQLEPESKCHLDRQEHCHHLLRCQMCEAIEEVHCPGTDTLVKELEKTGNFKIQSHSLEFVGLCGNCR